MTTSTRKKDTTEGKEDSLAKGIKSQNNDGLAKIAPIPAHHSKTTDLTCVQQLIVMFKNPLQIVEDKAIGIRNKILV